MSQEWQWAFDSIKDAILRVRQEIKAAIAETHTQSAEKRKDILAAAENNIDGLVKEADKFIDITKLSSDKIEINVKLIDMKDVVRNAIFVFEPKIRDKKLDLKLDIPKEKIDAEADPDRMKQVFEILISNSVKFTEKGYVAISVKESKEEVECSVQDTGIGIRKEDLPKIFDGPGHVSLTIAKGIIEKHNGKIWVESEPGKKTRFIFKIPRRPPT